MSSESTLNQWADWAAILTAAVSTVAFLGYLRAIRQRQQRLEQYLRHEMELNPEHKAHSLVHLMGQLRMTEAEILQASFRSKHIIQRVRKDQNTGLADRLMFEYSRFARVEGPSVDCQKCGAPVAVNASICPYCSYIFNDRARNVFEILGKFVNWFQRNEKAIERFGLSITSFALAMFVGGFLIFNGYEVVDLHLYGKYTTGSVAPLSEREQMHAGSMRTIYYKDGHSIEFDFGKSSRPQDKVTVLYLPWRPESAVVARDQDLISLIRIKFGSLWGFGLAIVFVISLFIYPIWNLWKLLGWPRINTAR